MMEGMREKGGLNLMALMGREGKMVDAVGGRS